MCVLSHERRALGALLSLFSRSEPTSTASQLQSGCGEARRLRSRIVVVFEVQRMDRYSYYCADLVMLLYQAGSAQLDFYLIKDRCHFSIR